MTARAVANGITVLGPNLDLVAEAIAGLGDIALSLNGALRALEVNPLWVNGDQVEALDVLVVTGPERAKGPPAATGGRSDEGRSRLEGGPEARRDEE